MKDKIYLLENKKTNEIIGIRRSSIPDSDIIQIPNAKTLGEAMCEPEWVYLTTLNVK